MTFFDERGSSLLKHELNDIEIILIKTFHRVETMSIFIISLWLNEAIKWNILFKEIKRDACDVI